MLGDQRHPKATVMKRIKGIIPTQVIIQKIVLNCVINLKAI